MSPSGITASMNAVGTAEFTCWAIACGLRLTDMVGPMAASEIAMAPKTPRFRFSWRIREIYRVKSTLATSTIRIAILEQTISSYEPMVIAAKREPSLLVGL
jgi:hypothetical protein